MGVIRNVLCGVVFVLSVAKIALGVPPGTIDQVLVVVWVAIGWGWWNAWESR